jgi:hypothetical protein
MVWGSYSLLLVPHPTAAVRPAKFKINLVTDWSQTPRNEPLPAGRPDTAAGP